jgi:hypothetical protein
MRGQAPCPVGSVLADELSAAAPSPAVTGVSGCGTIRHARSREKATGRAARKLLRLRIMRLHLRDKVSAVLVVATLAACGGVTTSEPRGGEGGSSSSSGGSSSGSGGGSSTGGSGSGSSSGAGARPVPAQHRPSDAQCSAPALPGDCSGPGPVPGGCTSDSSCAAGTNGRCLHPGGGPAADCFCTYDTCVHDTDCPGGQICACHGSPYTRSGNTCVKGNCRVDADCGASGYCSPSALAASCGENLAAYYCHTAGDLCVDDSDCPAASGGEIAACVYSTRDSRWECDELPNCP